MTSANTRWPGDHSEMLDAGVVRIAAVLLRAKLVAAVDSGSDDRFRHAVAVRAAHREPEPVFFDSDCAKFHELPSLPFFRT